MKLRTISRQRSHRPRSETGAPPWLARRAVAPYRARSQPLLRPPVPRVCTPHLSLRTASLLLALLSASPVSAQSPLAKAVDRHAAKVEAQVVAWRRDLHAHPELSNQEKRTAQLVADHLRRLGIEVRTGVGGTGVVGGLRGGRPGPVVALRADMDALPVTEEVDLPFKSTARAQFNGQEVGVMHACGHDLHVAILMGAAEVLANMRATLSGTVKFIFQPAEESSGTGPGGASAMLRRLLRLPAAHPRRVLLPRRHAPWAGHELPV